MCLDMHKALYIERIQFCNTLPRSFFNWDMWKLWWGLFCFVLHESMYQHHRGDHCYFYLITVLQILILVSLQTPALSVLRFSKSVITLQYQCQNSKIVYFQNIQNCFHFSTQFYLILFLEVNTMYALGKINAGLLFFSIHSEAKIIAAIWGSVYKVLRKIKAKEDNYGPLIWSFQIQFPRYTFSFMLVIIEATRYTPNRLEQRTAEHGIPGIERIDLATIPWNTISNYLPWKD